MAPRPGLAVVCDDDPVIRRIIGSILQGAGFDQIVEAALATDLLQMLPMLRPELVVLDVALPGMSGIEALPVVIERAPGALVIVVSAFDSLDEAVLRAGATAIVPKYELDRLEQVLTSLGVPNRRPTPPSAEPT